MAPLTTPCLCLAAALALAVLPAPAWGQGQRSRPGPAIPMDDGQNGKHWRSERCCGVSCCFLLLRMTGHAVCYDDVLAHVPIDQDRGSNLYDMKKGCGELGLDARVMRLTPREFETADWPAVALLHQPNSTGHYVVVL